MNRAANTPTDRASEDHDTVRRFSSFASGIDLGRIPPDVVARAKLSILDSIGIGLASVNYPFAEVMVAALSALAAAGECPVIGTNLRLTARDSAHLNGTLIHGLDFDDTHSESIVHTSASAIPTMISAGLTSGATGARALAAFVIGSECTARIGSVAGGGFHAKGFHPTAVTGAFGCTLAAGYLHDLTPEQLDNAQGIVLSKAAGSLQFLDDGAWTKRDHPGWASVAAQTAVAMAKHGFTGPRDPYFGRYGLYALYTADGCAIDHAQPTTDLGKHWEVRNIAFKAYPACHLAHACVDSILAIKRRHGLSAADIEQVTAHLHPGEIPILCEPVARKKRPQNSYDAQFSVHYLMAAAFLRDGFGLAELEDDAFRDPAILALCDKTTFEPDHESAYPVHYSGAVTVQTTDGRVLSHREQINRGSPLNPMSDDEIKGKYYDNATRTLSLRGATELLDVILGLDQQPDLKRFAALLSPA